MNCIAAVNGLSSTDHGLFLVYNKRNIHINFSSQASHCVLYRRMPKQTKMNTNTHLSQICDSFTFYVVFFLLKKKKNDIPTENIILQDSLLLVFAFSFSVHHFPEARKYFALPLSSFLLVKGSKRPLLISTVDLVFLSQTHSLHTPMSEGIKNSI